MKKHAATVHEGKKAFKCDICKTDFTSKHDMKGHIKTFHEENKPFKCEICNANFGEKSNIWLYPLQHFMKRTSNSNVMFVM